MKKKKWVDVIKVTDLSSPEEAEKVLNKVLQVLSKLGYAATTVPLMKIQKGRKHHGKKES